MSKARTVFLIASLIAFVASLTVISIEFIKFANECYARKFEKGTGEDLYYKFTSAEEDILVTFVLFVIPFVISELLIIKNGFVFLTPKQSVSRLLFCAISSVFAVSIIAILILWTVGFFEQFMYHIQMDIIGSLIPGVLISSTLGLLGKRKAVNQETVNQGRVCD